MTADLGVSGLHLPEHRSVTEHYFVELRTACYRFAHYYASRNPDPARDWMLFAINPLLVIVTRVWQCTVEMLFGCCILFCHYKTLPSPCDLFSSLRRYRKSEVQ